MARDPRTKEDLLSLIEQLEDQIEYDAEVQQKALTALREELANARTERTQAQNMLATVKDEKKKARDALKSIQVLVTGRLKVEYDWPPTTDSGLFNETLPPEPLEGRFLHHLKELIGKAL